MLKKIMWAVTFLALAGTAVVVQFMPETVPMHYDMSGNIDRWGSRYENLIFPLIMMLLSLLMTLLIRYYEKKAERSANEKERADAGTNVRVLGVTGAATAGMFAVLQGFILYGAYAAAVSGGERQAVDLGKVSCILLGILFIILGNFMTKTRINSTIGFRVSWSMYNDNTWRKSSRFAGCAVVATGVVTILLAVVMKNSLAAVMSSLGALFLACIAALIYAHGVYVKEIEAGGKKRL